MQTAADGCMQSPVHAVLQKQMTQHMKTGGTSLWAAEALCILYSAHRPCVSKLRCPVPES